MKSLTVMTQVIGIAHFVIVDGHYKNGLLDSGAMQTVASVV